MAVLSSYSLPFIALIWLHLLFFRIKLAEMNTYCCDLAKPTHKSSRWSLEAVKGVLCSNSKGELESSSKALNQIIPKDSSGTLRSAIVSLVTRTTGVREECEKSPGTGVLGQAGLQKDTVYYVYSFPKLKFKNKFGHKCSWATVVTNSLKNVCFESKRCFPSMFSLSNCF